MSTHVRTDKNEGDYVPHDGHTLLVGQVGSSIEWHVFDDTVKGREKATEWLGPNPGLKRLFRVEFANVKEMKYIPPMGARIVEKYNGNL